MKFKHKKILLICFMFLIACVTFKTVYAEVNVDSDPGIATDAFNWILKNLLSTTGGILGSVIAPLINVFSILIFLILYMLFVANGVTPAGGVGFPFPDSIVFNKIPLLDPNFINPADGSISKLANSMISKTYYSFFTLAVTVFVIAAMVIGIKLALSSLAAEKAQYKKALNNWIIGIVLLFTIHYVMAGIFYLNEQIVKEVSKSADGITIKFDVTEALPVVGKSLGKLINGVASIFGAKEKPTAIDLKGYGGIVLMYAAKGLIGQDLISSIVFLIIIGQTFGLVVIYIKRLFMCIVLGMLAPVVVAVDVIKKSLS